MRTEERDYLRYLRHQLGTAIRVADEVLEPQILGLEQGYRWEADEMLVALVAEEDLRVSAETTLVGLTQMLTAKDHSLTKPERTKITEAQQTVQTTLKEILGKLDRQQLAKLEAQWKPAPVGHEAYFLKYFQAAAKYLRFAWYEMFRASQKPSPVVKQLTARQSLDYHRPGSRYGAELRKEMDAAAKETGDLLEVYDADHDLVYVAVPGGSAPEKRAPRKQGGAAVLLKKTSRTEVEKLHQVLARHPGMSMREAADRAGVQLAESYTENPGRLDHAADVGMLRRLWNLTL